MSANPHIGSSFNAWLDEEGIRSDVDALAAKRDLVEQIETLRRRRRLSRPALARRARVSPTQLNRLLNPDQSAVSFRVLARVALALDKDLKIGLC